MTQRYIGFEREPVIGYGQEDSDSTTNLESMYGKQVEFSGPQINGLLEGKLIKVDSGKAFIQLERQLTKSSIAIDLKGLNIKPKGIIFSS